MPLYFIYWTIAKASASFILNIQFRFREPRNTQVAAKLSHLLMLNKADLHVRVHQTWTTHEICLGKFLCHHKLSAFKFFNYMDYRWGHHFTTAVQGRMQLSLQQTNWHTWF